MFVLNLKKIVKNKLDNILNVQKSIYKTILFINTFQVHSVRNNTYYFTIFTLLMFIELLIIYFKLYLFIFFT